MDDGDDLEWLKCTLVEKIVLQSPPEKLKMNHTVGGKM